MHCPDETPWHLLLDVRTWIDMLLVQGRRVERTPIRKDEKPQIALVQVSSGDRGDDGGTSGECSVFERACVQACTLHACGVYTLGSGD